MLDKDNFLAKYKVQKEFEISGLSWDTLEHIYDDYENRKSLLTDRGNDIKNYIITDMDAPFHTISSRVKNPEHLIEKIIRKRGKDQEKKYEKIDETNYYEIVRDLIGVRILTLSKEEWKYVFENIKKKFGDDKSSGIYMAENPIAYTRYGDRDIFNNLIHTEHTNKGYRSQHYVVKYKDYFCEIQVRTLAEEVFGEFDHRVKYPYRNENNFLRRYTSSVSQLLDSVDELISTCYQLGEIGWEYCDDYCSEDQYIDWKNIERKSEREMLNRSVLPDNGEPIDGAAYANKILLRKGFENE